MNYIEYKLYYDETGQLFTEGNLNQGITFTRYSSNVYALSVVCPLPPTYEANGTTINCQMQLNYEKPNGQPNTVVNLMSYDGEETVSVSGVDQVWYRYRIILSADMFTTSERLRQNTLILQPQFVIGQDTVLSFVPYNAICSYATSTPIIPQIAQSDYQSLVNTLNLKLGRGEAILPLSLTTQNGVIIRSSGYFNENYLYYVDVNNGRTNCLSLGSVIKCRVLGTNVLTSYISNPIKIVATLNDLPTYKLTWAEWVKQDISNDTIFYVVSERKFYHNTGNLQSSDANVAVNWQPFALDDELEQRLSTIETDILGKQDLIDSENKLLSDLVDDTGQVHKFVSETDKTTWNAKQNELNTTNVPDSNLAYIIGFDSNGNLKKTNDFGSIANDQATYDSSGVIKLGSNVVNNQTTQPVSTESNRQYALQLDSNGRASVNVPWTDTNLLIEVDLYNTTFAEITSIVENGKIPFYRRSQGNDLYICFYIDDQVANFSNLKTESHNDLQASVYSVYSSGNVVFEYGVLEITSHKVTSINQYSTDTQYPSARLLYNQLLLKQDKLPTIINGKYLHTNDTTGELEWVDASNVVVDQVYNSSSPNAQSGVAVASAINNALSGVYHFEGTKTVAQLNALTGQTNGAVYNVSDSGVLTSGNVSVNAGDNVAWVSSTSTWDKLASDIDLSSYYTKTQTDTLLNGKQNTLVNQTNIKSINGISLLGSGDLSIEAFFNCTYGTTTYAEITQAVSDGKLPICIYNNNIYYFYARLSSAYSFMAPYSDGMSYLICSTSNVWSYNTYELEFKSNKVTSLSSSSTNVQYPSAKAVYDNLLLKQDTITSTNKLSSDLVDDTNATNKFVSANEKATWNGKSTVSVSATGTSTSEVSYITVDGVEKKIGGGGSTVEANPVSSPTDNLNTVGIEGTVYQVKQFNLTDTTYLASVVFNYADSSSETVECNYSIVGSNIYLTNVE